MTWPIALFLAVAALLALAFVGSIAAMLGLKVFDALAWTVRRVLA